MATAIDVCKHGRFHSAKPSIENSLSYSRDTATELTVQCRRCGKHDGHGRGVRNRETEAKQMLDFQASL